MIYKHVKRNVVIKLITYINSRCKAQHPNPTVSVSHLAAWMHLTISRCIAGKPWKTKFSRQGGRTRCHVLSISRRTWRITTVVKCTRSTRLSTCNRRPPRGPSGPPWQLVIKIDHAHYVYIILSLRPFLMHAHFTSLHIVLYLDFYSSLFTLARNVKVK